MHGSTMETQRDSLTLRLWPEDAPGARGKEPEDVPAISVYAPPDNQNGAAIVVCPGGGYGTLASHEGEPVARWLNTLGITGIVLKYRLGPRYRHPIMLQDAARALRLVRTHARQWQIVPHRVGILGFSAGGHLASTLATRFDDGDPLSPDPVERESCRPNLAILIYPVISLLFPHAHMGSRQTLIGANASEEMAHALSNETQVTGRTPPTFLVHTAEDIAVPCTNSLLFALALRKAGVPVALHLFERGTHGFGLAEEDPVLSVWPALCARWLEVRGFVATRAVSE